MLTEDAFRRRELADLGIRAEVQSDGHTVVVTLDRPQFDDLFHLASGGPTEVDCDCDDAAGDAYIAGHDAAIAEIKALAEQAVAS